MSAPAPSRFGFVGLGNMGGPMAANVAAAGFDLAGFDTAGSAALAPDGTRPVGSLGELVAAVDTLFLSLPDGPVSIAVANEIAGAPERAVSTVIDTSTIGIAAATDAHAVLADAGIAYIDAPVSGGTAGARAATISLMWAGPVDLLEAHRPVCGALSKNIFHVGERPGQGQAMKLLNNFLSATAMVATSEAVGFGLTQGLEMATMLDVLNVSSGRNSASGDKFPNRIATGSYDAGFHTALMTKDAVLYLENARAAGVADAVGSLVAEIWQRCNEALPESDFTRVYDFIRGKTPE